LLSSRPISKQRGRIKCGGGVRSSVLTFEEGAALDNFLVDDELLVIGGDEEDHRWSSG